jgi:hypothetical protein
MRSGMVVFLAVLMAVLIAGAETASAGPRFLRSSMDGGDGAGPSVDIIVHEVNVDPMVAHVGDSVLFEMVLEDHGDPVKTTIPIEIKAYYGSPAGGSPGRSTGRRWSGTPRGFHPANTGSRGKHSYGKMSPRSTTRSR